MNHNRDESSPKCGPDSVRVLARYQAAHEAETNAQCYSVQR